MEGVHYTANVYCGDSDSVGYRFMCYTLTLPAYEQDLGQHSGISNYEATRLE